VALAAVRAAYLGAAETGETPTALAMPVLTRLRPCLLLLAFGPEGLAVGAWPDAAVQLLLGEVGGSSGAVVPPLLQAALLPRLCALVAAPSRVLQGCVHAAAVACPRALLDAVLGPLLAVHLPTLGPGKGAGCCQSEKATG
jgi:hypothetical protein